MRVPWLRSFAVLAIDGPSPWGLRLLGVVWLVTMFLSFVDWYAERLKAEIVEREKFLHGETSSGGPGR